MLDICDFMNERHRELNELLTQSFECRITLIELVISRKTGKLPLTSSDSIESETETED